MAEIMHNYGYFDCRFFDYIYNLNLENDISRSINVLTGSKMVLDYRMANRAKCKSIVHIAH